MSTAILRGEPFSPPADLLWGALAGSLVLAGYGCLLHGFARGRMGIVAPVSGVLATAIPVIFAAFTEGLPRGVQLLGFGLAFVSIWLLSRPEKFGSRPAGLGMAFLAGGGFGGFFTALDQVGQRAVFWPLAAGRLTACGLLVAFAFATRRSLMPQVPPLARLVLLGLLDVGGNPMAIILVVSLMRHLPPANVFKTIRSGETADLYNYIYHQSWQAISHSAKDLLFTIQRAGDVAEWSWLELMDDGQQLPLQAAIRELTDFSLVYSQGGENGDRRYSIHRLTSTFLRTEILGWK